MEDIPKNNLGITKEEILTEIKLVCLQNGIKESKELKNYYLYLNFNTLPLKENVGDLFNIDFEYTKSCKTPEMIKQNGSYYVPEQDEYGTLGIADKKEFILENIRKQLKKFLVDYLESNIE